MIVRAMSAIQPRRCRCCGLRSTTTLPRSGDASLSAWISTLRASPPMHWWMETLLPALAAMEPEDQSQAVLAIWQTLPQERLFLFNKLLTGGFRIGVGTRPGGESDRQWVRDRRSPGAGTLDGTSGGILDLVPTAHGPAEAERENRGPVPYPFFWPVRFSRRASAKPPPRNGGWNRNGTASAAS